MPHALFKGLHADLVDHQELLSLLSAHFGLSQGDRGGGVLYPREDVLRMRVRMKDDRIVDIEPGPLFEPTEVVDLERKVREKLIDKQVPSIHTGIAFSLSTVNGFFRAPGDLFQLIPAPPQAPRPPYVMGDHPLVIEYPVVTSTDWSITGDRSRRALTEWVWFLNAILLDHFSTITSRSRHMWVMCPDWTPDPQQSGPQVPNVIWGQEMYIIPDWSPSTSGFSEPSWPAIATRPQNEYYRLFGSSGDALDLPDSFASDVQRFASLDQAKRRRFLLAAQWRTAAHNLWDSHISSSYIAQVAAIETLAYENEPPDHCSECGRDKNQRPTARFKDFLERFARGAGTRADHDRLYSLRSGLVHGETLLHHDSPVGHSLAFATNEREPMDRLSAAVSVAMVNWLRFQTTVGAAPPS
jgi:hypothetical protein